MAVDKNLDVASVDGEKAAKDEGSQAERLRVFMDVYGFNIDEYVMQLQSQFSSVVNAKTNERMKWKIAVHLIESGTRVALVKNAGAPMVYHLYIGFGDLEVFAKSADMDMFDAFCKLVTHEYMHFVLGHLDKRNEKLAHAITVNKSKAGIVQSQFSIVLSHKVSKVSNLALKMLASACDSQSGNKFDPDIFNFACDLEINSLINMKGCSLRAEVFGLPENLQCYHYYSIIYHILNSFPEGEIKTKNFCSSGRETFISKRYMPNRELIKRQYQAIVSTSQLDEMCDDDINKLRDGINKALNDALLKNGVPVMLGDIANTKGMEVDIPSEAVAKIRNRMISESMNQGNISYFINRMKIAKFGIWKDFYDLILALEREHQKTKMSKVDRVNNWTKFNNRKDGMGLLYPGIERVSGKIEHKIEESKVLFVDVSESMSDVAQPLYAFCYLALKRLNMEIVMYNTHIVAEIDSASKLNMDCMGYIGGGTLVCNAIKEYKDKHGKMPRHIFVLSDTLDDSYREASSLISGTLRVWKITPSGLKEAFKI